MNTLKSPCLRMSKHDTKMAIHSRLENTTWLLYQQVVKIQTI